MGTELVEWLQSAGATSSSKLELPELPDAAAADGGSHCLCNIMSGKLSVVLAGGYIVACWVDFR
jgi:hypothetical protein